MKDTISQEIFYTNYKFTYWNIEGINTLYNLSRTNSRTLMSSSILCLVETWHTNPINVTKMLGNFYIIEQLAIKEHTKGRAKGGMVVLVSRSEFNFHSVIHRSNNTLLIHISCRFTHRHFLVGNVYIPPTSVNDNLLYDFIDQLELFIEEYPDAEYVIGGDFNARVGTLGTLPAELDCVLPVARSSCDVTIDSRGETLVDFMLECDMLLLNGRVEGDMEGSFIFVSGTGKSVIDLIFASPSIASVATSLIVHPTSDSHHFPIILNCQKPAYFANSYIPLSSTVFSWKKDNEKIALYKTQMTQTSASCNPNEPLYPQLINCITESAWACGMAFESQNITGNSNKPWYDKDCRDANKHLLSSLQIAKSTNWDHAKREQFLTARKEYKNTKRQKKRDYWNSLKDTVSSSTTQQDFWASIKPFKLTPAPPNVVDEHTWLEFYRKLMPRRERCMDTFTDVRHPTLDTEITPTEVLEAARRLSNKKAPGPDGIKNEFLKAIPAQVVPMIAACFTHILESETTPDTWAESITVMIFKKGDRNDPANYRPIALLNTLLKLFTQVLHNRLATWCIQAKILPEAQGGFRSGRGCEDQIFVLNTAIQLGTRIPGSKLYALFIDFARAFPSIPHKKLWHKLFQIGVSGKFIQILRHLYESSATKIRLQDGYSEEIPMTEGLLQGEVLSPLLFSLYISDIEDILKEFGVAGITIDSNLEIQILLYADDMVVLSATKLGLKMKIRRLEKYFDAHDLKVSLGKTKVVIFRRGGRIPSGTQFTYKGEEIEIVNHYTYLGVPFYSSCVFGNTAKSFKQKGLVALGAA